MAEIIKPKPSPITKNEDIDSRCGNLFVTHLVYAKPVQILIICLEKCLMVLDKTALWIDETDRNNSTALVRPLPRILFLPLCLTLRYAQIALSFVGTCFGYEAFTIASTRSQLKNGRKWLQSCMYESIRMEIASSDEESDQESDEDGEDPQSTDLYTKILLNQTIESDEGCDEDYIPHESESTDTDTDYDSDDMEAELKVIKENYTKIPHKNRKLQKMVTVNDDKPLKEQAPPTTK